MFGRLKDRLWRLSEAWFHRLAGFQPIAPGEERLFYIAKRTYIGLPFTVDGERVRLFSRVIELHLNNELVHKLLYETNLVGFSLKFLREARRSFPALARAVRDPKYAGRRVVYGVSFVHRAIAPFGLVTFDLRNPLFRAMTRHHLKGVFLKINPRGTEVLASHEEEFQPKLVAMSVEKLIAMHDPDGGPLASA